MNEKTNTPEKNVPKQMKSMAHELKRAEKDLESALKTFNKECERHGLNPREIITNPKAINTVMGNFDKSKQFANFVRKFVDYNEAITKVNEIRARVEMINSEAIAKEIDQIVSPPQSQQPETA